MSITPPRLPLFSEAGFMALERYVANGPLGAIACGYGALATLSAVAVTTYREAALVAGTAALADDVPTAPTVVHAVGADEDATATATLDAATKAPAAMNAIHRPGFLGNIGSTPFSTWCGPRGQLNESTATSSGPHRRESRPSWEGLCGAPTDQRFSWHRACRTKLAGRRLTAQILNREETG
jgi:hypothetical protein